MRQSSDGILPGVIQYSGPRRRAVYKVIARDFVRPPRGSIFVVNVDRGVVCVWCVGKSTIVVREVYLIKRLSQRPGMPVNENHFRRKSKYSIKGL